MNTQDRNNDFNRTRNDGRIFAGLFLLFVGAIFLMKELSFPFFPHWLFTWPMILIAVGIYSGIKHQFRNVGWLIPILIGGIFLFDQMDLGYDLHRFIVPAIIISIGLVMILRPRGNRNWHRPEWSEWQREKIINEAHGNPPDYSSEDFFDSTAVFGAVKKVVISKNFKGGDITCFMGGCEIDFTQADMTQPAVLDLSLVFGGGKIIVPSHWQVRNQITPVFGGVEDKRQQPISNNPDKILVIKGTCFFGGLEIKSF
jgi:predicted membrane protein